jgi:hypothetical protein
MQDAKRRKLIQHGQTQPAENVYPKCAQHARKTSPQILIVEDMQVQEQKGFKHPSAQEARAP